MHEHHIFDIAGLACNLLEQILLLERETHSRSGIDAVAQFQMHFSGTDSSSIDFDRVNQDKLAPLFEYFTRQLDRGVLGPALDSWVVCHKRGYLSLEMPARTSGLIKLLHAAKISIDKIFVCTEINPSGDEPQARKLLSQVISVFSSVYPVPPRLDVKSPRRGRPSAYLVFSSAEPKNGKELQSAAISMAGFHALFFAAHIYLKFLDHQQSNPTNEGISHD